MDDRDLLMIKYLNQFKNVTKAANALFISQPALTSRIHALERELGAKLLHSSNKGIIFTPSGLELVDFADKVLTQLDTLKNNLRAIEDENAGLIRITGPYIICYYYMPQIIKAFRKIYPKVQFSVHSAPSSEVITLMNQNKFDFGFLRNDFGWEEKQSVRLSVDYIAVISMTPFKKDDLPNMQRVSYSTDHYYTKMLELWWNNNFMKPPKVDVMVNSLDLCKEMVYSGLGFGILPSVFLPECPDAYSFILQDQAGNPIERVTRLVYKRDNISGKIAKKFLEFLQKEDFSSFFHSKR